MTDDTKTENEGPATGTATASRETGDAVTPVAILDGPCITKTLRRIQDMPPEALAAVRSQSESLVGQVLSVYASEIADGEVGDGGTALAGPNSKSKGLGPTGLLYGRIQSGKTVAMITFTALAIDNGFRVVIVLTTNFVELVKQTKDRFNDLGRVLVRASTEPDEWSKPSEVQHLKKHLPDRGLVLVCAKHTGHLENVLELLKSIGADGYPALILDDEADQASLDNNERRRGRAQNPDDIQATAVHSAIKDIRVCLRHHIFLQVTATPYALLLQRVTNPLRPSFTFLLEPGQGYTGGEDFFSVDRVGNETGEAEPPVVYVSEDESTEIEAAPKEAPRGLENAITYFLVASAAQALLEPRVLGKSQNFLCHTSHKKSEHDKLHELIIDFTSKLADELDPLQGRTQTIVNWAYAELQKTLPDAPPLDEIVDDIGDRLPRRKVRVVNSEGKSGEEVRGAPNFIIGGNIVGRGLTIPNLLVTYYLRKPKISQMDTMLQHARMFGYRKQLMPYTRVFLPRSLGLRFWGIHEAENELRGLLPNMDALAQVPVQVIGSLRATRYGVLDTGSVVTVSSGKHLYPLIPTTKLPAKRHKAIEDFVRTVWPNWKKESSGLPPQRITVAQAIELLRLFAVPEWDNSALTAIMSSASGESEQAFVSYRPMRRGKNRPANVRHLATGALSGSELRDARNMEIPSFFIFRQLDPVPCWDAQLFWYPTIVFPSSMPNQVYNNTELDS